MEAHRLRRHDVHQRASLHPRKNDFVDCLRELCLGENHPRPRPAQGLMGRRSDDVGVGHGRRMRPACNQAGEVSHVNQIECSHAIGNLPHAGKIDGPRISASTADD